MHSVAEGMSSTPRLFGQRLARVPPMGRRDGRSVLLVAQLSPPSALVAARRVAGMTKYLSRLGYAVTVLTSRASGQGPIEGAEQVVRTSDALTTRLNWRRRHFEALGGGSSNLYKPPSRLESVVVPDLALVGWLPFALPTAVRLVRGRRFDCIISSSPPQSAHLIGLALKRRGIPWIAELRDGWTFDPPRRDWPTRLQRRLDVALERRVVGGADAVVGVTKPIADDLSGRFGVDAVVITNGFDPEETGGEGRTDLLDRARHSLVYTGRLAVAGRSVDPLLAAVRALRAAEPHALERMELVFAGPLTRDEQLVLAAPDLAGVVRTVGSLDRAETCRLQRAADSLLVVAQGISSRSVATGKLFEYLGAGRPILVLGEETEAARIVAETGTGTATSAVDHRAIADALQRLIKTAGLENRDASAVSRYAWPELAARYAELIESVAAD
jgi:glycosyltransferase involved in cell wall biosynthesis